MSRREGILSRAHGAWLSLGLRAKLVWFALVAGLVPLTIVGVFTYTASQKALDNGFKSQLASRSHDLALDIEQYNAQSRVTLLSIGSSPAWLNFYTQPKLQEEWRLEQQRIINYMDDVTKIGIEEFCFIGKNGKENTRLVLGGLEYDLSEDEAGNPFFEPSFKLDEGEVFQSKPYKSPDTGRWVTASTTPVLDPSGEKVAFLHLERSLTQVHAILKRAASHKGEVAYLLDEKGDVVLSSSASPDGSQDTLAAKLPADLQAKIDSTDNEDINGEGAVQSYRKAGSPYYLSERSLDLGVHNENKWRLVVVAPQGAITQYSNSFSRLPFLLAIITGLVVAYGWVMSGTIKRPLTELLGAANRVADGDLDVTVPVAHRDEIGALSAAFNKMTVNLKKLVEAETSSKEYLQSTVSEYKAFVEQVSGGDLTCRLELNGGQDELSALGHNLNGMVHALGEMTANIREATNDIASASSEIFAATSQHSAAATEQASAINETTTTVDEVRQTAEQASERAMAVANTAQKSVKISDAGQQDVNDTVKAMNEIREKVGLIATNISSLAEQSRQIGDIIASVNDIAEQSHLLALNASIEAARAGEHGKGFAVVATEVSNLAEQSQQATGQVKSILDDIQRATNTVVMVTEEGTKDVEAGVLLAGQTGETITSLSEAIREAAAAAQQIVASAQQQTAGMDQIAAAMSSINQSTSQSLASTKQTETATQNLSDLGVKLKDLVGSYRIE